MSEPLGTQEPSRASILKAKQQVKAGINQSTIQNSDRLLLQKTNETGMDKYNRLRQETQAIAASSVAEPISDTDHLIQSTPINDQATQVEASSNATNKPPMSGQQLAGVRELSVMMRDPDVKPKNPTLLQRFRSLFRSKTPKSPPSSLPPIDFPQPQKKAA